MSLEHFSQFVPPGSVRVASSEEEQLASVAFLTPQHKVVLVVSNTANFPKSFAVKYHDTFFADYVTVGVGWNLCLVGMLRLSETPLSPHRTSGLSEPHGQLSENSGSRIIAIKANMAKHPARGTNNPARRLPVPRRRQTNKPRHDSAAHSRKCEHDRPNAPRPFAKCLHHPRNQNWINRSQSQSRGGHADRDAREGSCPQQKADAGGSQDQTTRQ